MTQIAEATRTFFFADLRDYTGFVERSGDQAAAELLTASVFLHNEQANDLGAFVRRKATATRSTAPAAASDGEVFRIAFIEDFRARR